MPGSIPGHVCRPGRSEFSMAFSETCVNTGEDPLEKPLRRALSYRPRSQKRTIGLNPTSQLNPTQTNEELNFERQHPK